MIVFIKLCYIYVFRIIKLKNCMPVLVFITNQAPKARVISYLWWWGPPPPPEKSVHSNCAYMELVFYIANLT